MTEWLNAFQPEKGPDAVRFTVAVVVPGPEVENLPANALETLRRFGTADIVNVERISYGDPGWIGREFEEIERAEAGDSHPVGPGVEG